jgi:uncharacterized protein YfaS (alpha-2-macroglobulin family)
MVQANAPRFMREGDNMEFSGKIVNLTEKEITGQVYLEFIDPQPTLRLMGGSRMFFLYNILRWKRDKVLQ